MSPPITLIPYREVCNEGITVDGEYIPAGIDVGTSIYSLHHNEDLFPDSYTFKPERWIESTENPQELIERARYAFSPFSVGSRSCAGRNLAYIEISDVLARTLWYLHFRQAVGPLGSIGGGSQSAGDGRDKVKEFQIRERLTSQHDGPFLESQRRKAGGRL